MLQYGALMIALVLLFAAGFQKATEGQDSAVRFSQSADTVEAYDFVEVSITVENPSAANPFTEVMVSGQFSREGGAAVPVDGFCDSLDGRLFRIRFMPSHPGRYTYSVLYEHGGTRARHQGSFSAIDGRRKGIVRVDAEHPWHFVWEGTGEHYFYNGTTAYFLAGWDEAQMRANLDRLARLKVNRVRSALAGRVKDGQAWFENVYNTEHFHFCLNPWIAEHPESVENPGFDVTRFNVEYWRKWEALLRHARELDIVVSVIFYVDGRRPGVDPFGQAGMGGEAEQRYYRYAAARFSAFSNVMWDLANEYRFFRDDAWAEKMGPFLKGCDPYDHLISVHGFGDFRFRMAPWADFAMYQSWDEGGGYAFMLRNRQEQANTGRPIPQVNEEYGYEDHYPRGWGGNRTAPARSADNRRRLAWGMYMAGGYQTAGERADTGTGWGPDTGGGWINGRGDDSMVLFKGYGYLVDFFTSIPWWTLEPDNSFIDTSVEGPVKTELSHIVYTRTPQGEAVMYVDGEPIAKATVLGEVSNWDGSFRLALANELTRNRTWLGEYRRVAIYDRAFEAEEVAGAFRAGPTEGVEGPIVLYTFAEGEGDTVRDVSGEGEPLDLAIADPQSVTWLTGGGLAVRDSTLIASAEPATKVIQAIQRTGAITVEVWVKPATLTQGGPARIVSLSLDPGQRNFTLGQAGGAYEMRFRTTTTSPNGEPSLWSPGGEGGTPRVMALRSPRRDLAVVYLPEGGEFGVQGGALVTDLQAQWYDPRSGKWLPAKVGPDGRFHAPDENDWAILFRRP
ncbi:MAG: LamG-like jellyroll fold domain-containing protein [Candidatus Zipacnadales bacterium]